jgi:hypothetical protein
MPITRSYANAFNVTDYSMELALVPLAPTLLNDSGLFSEEMLSTHTVTFEEISQSIGLVGDTYRGSKPQANFDDKRKIRSYPLAHFALTDAILPQDIQGVRAYGSTDAAETEAAVMVRKMEKIRKSFDQTLERARFSTLTSGAIFAPNGTIAGNFFTDFGITQTSVNFALDTATTDVVGKVEAVIAAMQDGADTGDVITGIQAHCSPEFFASLISHPKIQAAFQFYASTQEPLRNRLGGSGLYRRFVWQNVEFVEVRQSIGGTRLIPANEAVFVPMGTTDSFVTYFGPCSKMEFVNTIAERTYLFSYADPKGEKIELDASSDFINVLRRPQLVIKGVRN